MKRSVAIARALAAQPEAILYDEPTTMVDPLMGRLLGNLIQKLKHQLRLTSIVVTHDMRLLSGWPTMFFSCTRPKLTSSAPWTNSSEQRIPSCASFSI